MLRILPDETYNPQTNAANWDVINILTNNIVLNNHGEKMGTLLNIAKGKFEPSRGSVATCVPTMTTSYYQTAYEPVTGKYYIYTLFIVKQKGNIS